MDKLKYISEQIKKITIDLGFDKCGICAAVPVQSEHKNAYNEWIKKEFHADMEYLSRNIDKRFNPELLVDNAKSVISVILNYYPEVKQNKEVPQFAYYSYGLDYHDVMKGKLSQLLNKIKELLPESTGRYFSDTAPVMERYWASQAGIGFIGKNSLLIVPKKGSYFFIGEILLDKELYYDKPLTLSCGKCTLCLDNCPTNAFAAPYILNANKCISYQTIENKGEINQTLAPLFGKRMYGCDVCQQICPWNRYAKPHKTQEFLPKDEFMNLDWDSIESMQVEDYQRIFKGSAVKRAKFSGIKRNFTTISKFRKDNSSQSQS